MGTPWIVAALLLTALPFEMRSAPNGRVRMRERTERREKEWQHGNESNVSNTMRERLLEPGYKDDKDEAVRTISDALEGWKNDRSPNDIKKEALTKQKLPKIIERIFNDPSFRSQNSVRLLPGIRYCI